MDFRLTGKLGEKMAEKWGKVARKWLKNGIWGPFLPFSANFLPISLVRPFLPDFGPKARRQSVAGQRDLKIRAREKPSFRYVSQYVLP